MGGSVLVGLEVSLLLLVVVLGAGAGKNSGVVCGAATVKAGKVETYLLCFLCSFLLIPFAFFLFFFASFFLVLVILQKLGLGLGFKIQKVGQSVTSR